MADDTAKVVIGVDIGPFIAGIKQMPTPAEEAAKKVSAGFSAEFNKVSAGAAALASKVGGPFGLIASTANSAIRPLADVATGLGTVGVAGAAVAGVAVAIAASAAAMYMAGKAAFDLGDAAVSAASSLEKMGLGAMVPHEARASIADYTDAQRLLDIATKELTVRLGSEFLPTLTELVRGTVAIIQVGEKWLPQLEAIDEKLRDISPVVQLWRYAEGELTDSVELANAALQAQSDKAADFVAYGPSLEDHIKAVSQKWLDQDKALKALIKTQREKEADDRLARAQAQIAEMAAQEAHSQGTHKYTAEEQAMRDFDATTEAEKEARFDADVKRDKAWTAHVSDKAAAEVGFATDTLSAWSDVGMGIVSMYEAREAAGEHLTKAEVRTSNAALAAADAAALLTAGTQATIAAISGIASLQAVGIPAPVAIPLGIAEGVGLFAAAAMGIASHKPMQYTYRGQEGGGSKQPGDMVAGDTDGDGQPDDNSKPTIPTGDDQRSRKGGGHVTVGVDSRTRRLTFRTDSSFGKRTVIR